MGALSISSEDERVISLWEALFNKFQPSASLSDFRMLFLWARAHGFLSDSARAFVKEEWSLVGDCLWSTLSAYETEVPRLLLRWKRVCKILDAVSSPFGAPVPPPAVPSPVSVQRAGGGELAPLPASPEFGEGGPSRGRLQQAPPSPAPRREVGGRISATAAGSAGQAPALPAFAQREGLGGGSAAAAAVFPSPSAWDGVARRGAVPALPLSPQTPPPCWAGAARAAEQELRARRCPCPCRGAGAELDRPARPRLAPPLPRRRRGTGRALPGRCRAGVQFPLSLPLLCSLPSHPCAAGGAEGGGSRLRLFRSAQMPPPE